MIKAQETASLLDKTLEKPVAALLFLNLVVFIACVVHHREKACGPDTAEANGTAFKVESFWYECHGTTTAFEVTDDMEPQRAGVPSPRPYKTTGTKLTIKGPSACLFMVPREPVLVIRDGVNLRVVATVQEPQSLITFFTPEVDKVLLVHADGASLTLLLEGITFDSCLTYILAEIQCSDSAGAYPMKEIGVCIGGNDLPPLTIANWQRDRYYPPRGK